MSTDTEHALAPVSYVGETIEDVMAEAAAEPKETASELLERMRRERGNRTPGLAVQPLAASPSLPSGDLAEATGGPAPAAKTRPRTRQPRPAKRPDAPGPTRMTPALDEATDAQAGRYATGIPASVYERGQQLADERGLALTDYTLVCLNRHAGALRSAFPAAPDVVTGPVPVLRRVRHRRGLEEPLRRLTLYVVDEQLQAIDAMVVECNAGSRSALVTKALELEAATAER